MKVGYFQYDVKRSAKENIQSVQKQLERQRYDLLVLPELSMGGYLFENREELLQSAEPVPKGSCCQEMLLLSRQYGCTLVFGIAEKEGGAVYNTAVMVSKGRYLGKYRKIHLTDFEKKLFSPGTENTIFEVDGVKIGVQICFDLWFPEISREQIRMGADLLCVLANFGSETTYHISRIRAIENLVPLVLCNRIGTESLPRLTADFIGKSTVIDASGLRLCDAPANRQALEGCEIAPKAKRANVICSDFDSEMAFHYQE